MSKRSNPDHFNNDNQKTHYWIKPNKRQKNSYLTSIFNRISGTSTKHKTPFRNLFNGKETDENVKIRYEMFNKIWQYQLSKVQLILNNTNVEFFDNLLDYINTPIDSTLNSRVVRSNHKLQVGFLSLSSNIANNLRILQEFNKFLEAKKRQDQCTDIKLINLNSKSCANIKSALREVIKQILSLRDVSKDGQTPNESGDEEGEEDASDYTDAEEELGKEELAELPETRKEKFVDVEGRVSYDFDIVEDWCNNYFVHEKSNYKTTRLRIVLILQDSDSVNHHVLNQLVKLLHSYSNKLPIKLLMGLSSNNVSSWINSNLNNDVRVLINGLKFTSNDNKKLGYRILNELFLNHELNDLNPLSLDSTLATILLNRFENSNNSIDSLISEIKLCYMIYFYQSPLSGFVNSTFEQNHLYIDALKKLPSFKRFIESKVFKLNETKQQFEKEIQKNEIILPKKELDQRMHDNETKLSKSRQEIKDLLSSSEILLRLFDNARNDFQNYKLSIINVTNIIYNLQIVHQKEKLEIYKLITNSQLINSIYLNEIMKNIKNASTREITDKIRYLKESNELINELSNFEDDKLIKLREDLNSVLINELTSSKLVLVLQKFLNNVNLSKSINRLLFNEIFTLNGGLSDFNSFIKIEENFENLMINLIRPNLRSILELGLNDSDSYLKNELILKEIKRSTQLKPIISQFFGIYKDAPVSINIYDFFIAFKHSLNKEDVLRELKENLKSSKLSNKKILLNLLQDKNLDWDKLTYSWFVQNCFELIMIGLLKEKIKGDYLEKAIWKGI